MIKKSLYFPIAFLFIFFTAFCQSRGDVWSKLPQAKGWVNDFEDIFTVQEENLLDSLIAVYEKRTTTEITIVSIPVDATPIDSFDQLTLKLANEWGVGKKDKNNGILIGISKGHRKMRIQVGFGLEETLSDQKTQDIINKVFIPYFKNNQYFNGVLEGTQAIMNTLDYASQSEIVNLNDYSVFQFIDMLKLNDDKNNSQKYLRVTSIEPQKWFSENDIDSLMTFIHSTVPSKCVMQIASSHLPNGESSTLGAQVMNILEAYKNNQSYPIELSNSATTDSEKIERLKKWWMEMKK